LKTMVLFTKAKLKKINYYSKRKINYLRICKNWSIINAS
jgi:hypothetical protein